MLIDRGVKRCDIDVAGRHYTRVTGAEISGACFIKTRASLVSTGVANVPQEAAAARASAC